MSNDPYDLSDKAIDLLNRKAIKRFRSAQRKASLLKFDELNVIKIVKDLYDALEDDNRKAFLDLAKMVYKRENDEIEDEELFELWVLDEVLGKPNEVTKYTYDKEVPRKRDRATESIIAATDKGKEFKKALRYWSDQTREYCDLITDAAMLKAFEDSGFTKVQWHTEEDDRVCEICGPRDKKIYPISKVPAKPHWGCRCTISPVKE